MSMTPREIHEKHFHDAFRGYNHEEVDTFLDEVAEAFERLHRDNQNLLRRVADLQEQVNRLPEAPMASPVADSDQDDMVSESLLKRMLVMAQETADKAVQEARQKSQALVEKAQGRAQQLEDEARAKADATVADAEKRVAQLEESALDSRRELEQARAGLRRFDEEYRAQFRMFIESQLESLNNMPASPDPVPPVSIFDSTRAMPSSNPAESDPEKAFGTEGGPAQDAASEPSDRPADGAADQMSQPHPGAGKVAKGGPESVVAAVTRGPVGGSQSAAEAPGSPPASSAERGSGKARPSEDDGDEDRLIRELFWGEE